MALMPSSEPSSLDKIILIGFMGTGKSTVGRIAATMLGFQFIDTDALVVQKNGCSIAQLFETEGESFFRNEETEALQSLQERSRVLIATGGGIVTQPQNIPIMKGLAPVIWLTASEDVIFERVSRNKQRPLLQTPNPRGTIHELLEKRLPLYEKAADAVVDTSHQTHEHVARQVISAAERLVRSSTGE